MKSLNLKLKSEKWDKDPLDKGPNSEAYAKKNRFSDLKRMKVKLETIRDLKVREEYVKWLKTNS